MLEWDGKLWGGGGAKIAFSYEKQFEVSLLIEYILYFSLVLSPPPTPPPLDDLKCFIYVLMMFLYQPCLG